jgi:hypothetical protein
MGAVMDVDKFWDRVGLGIIVLAVVICAICLTYSAVYWIKVVT